MMLKIGKCSSYGVNSLLFVGHALLYSTSTLKGGTSPVFANYLIRLGLSRAQADPIASKLAQRWQNKKRKDDCYFKSMDNINHAPSSEFARIWRNRGAKTVTDFNFVSNADSVVSFLQHCGFRLPHVRLIVSEAPMILVSKVNTIKPKVQAFLDLGLSVNNIVNLLGKSPNLFHYGTNSTIVPTLRLLKRLLGNDVVSFVNVDLAVYWYNNGFQRFSKTFVPKMNMLLDYGVDTANCKPRQHLEEYWYYKLRKVDTQTLKNIAIMVDKKLGIPPHSDKFMTIVCVFCHGKGVDHETLDSFKKVFKSFGWTDSQIGLLVRTGPRCLTLSDDTISTTLDFLTNQVGYDPNYMASRPSLFYYCLKTEIVPRYEVFRILKEKGLIKMYQDFWRALQMIDSEFEEKFVVPYEDVHRVYCQHTNRGEDIERALHWRNHCRSLETKN